MMQGSVAPLPRASSWLRLMAGDELPAGPGRACLDALRCAAFLAEQHGEDVDEALTMMAVGSWLRPLVERLTRVGGLVDNATGSRQKRRNKRQKKAQGLEKEKEGDESTASSEEVEEEGGEASGDEGGVTGRDPRGGAAAVAGAERGAMVSKSSSNGSSRRGEASVGSRRLSAVSEALGSGDVLGCIFSFLAAVGGASMCSKAVDGGSSTARQSVRQLGWLGLVCRKWREVAGWDELWGAADELLLLTRRGGGGSRRRVLERGRVVGPERRVWVGEWEWAQGLSIHLEVFDRLDGLQLLSLGGGLSPGWDMTQRWVLLESWPRDQWGWRATQPFSAASRSRTCRPIASVRDYFGNCTSPRLASPTVCVRVVVTDERTGRSGLLWHEEAKGMTEWEVVDEQEGMGPPGSFRVRCALHAAVCPHYSGPVIRGQVDFGVAPVGRQAEGLPEVDRLYFVRGVDPEFYQYWSSYTVLSMRDVKPWDEDEEEYVDEASVGKFIRSVLLA